MAVISFSDNDNEDRQSGFKKSPASISRIFLRCITVLKRLICSVLLILEIKITCLNPVQIIMLQHVHSGTHIIQIVQHFWKYADSLYDGELGELIAAPLRLILCNLQFTET